MVRTDWKPAAKLILELQALGVPRPVREHRFHEPRPGERRRLWRFDLAWPEVMVACEVEGGTWSQTSKSRHTTGKGYMDDCLKYSTAALQGWIVVRADAKMVERGTAAALVQRALEAAECSAAARKKQGGK